MTRPPRRLIGAAWRENSVAPLVESDVDDGARAGDGVFETVRTYGGRPAFLGSHVKRLRWGASAVGLRPVPPERAVREACLQTLRRAVGSSRGSREWVLRPALYFAAGGARLAVTVRPLPAPRVRRGAGGVVAGISRYPHPGKFMIPPGASGPVKWIARGPLSHALREARACGWEEAILANDRGALVEGTRSNLLAVVDGALVSPGPESLALAGITRETVLAGAREIGLSVEDRGLPATELASAGELLLTSTLLEVAEVTRVAGHWRPRRGRGESVGAALEEFLVSRARESAESCPS